jgi:phosphorylase kinase alpha/beta subunit
LENKSNGELLHLLKQFDGLTNQAFILRILYTREGAMLRVEGQPIVECMESLISRAGVHKKWELVRLLAATLGKLVDSLAPSLTTILVRGKQVRSF